MGLPDMEIADAERFMKRCAKVKTWSDFYLWVAEVAKCEGFTEKWVLIAD